jgi:hypothetical protein
MDLKGTGFGDVMWYWRRNWPTSALVLVVFGSFAAVTASSWARFKIHC